MASEAAFEEVPEPGPPSEAEVEQMREHRRDEHRVDFELDRDVSYAGNVSATAPMTYIAPTDASRGGYYCADCRGKRLLFRDDPYAGTPERRRHLSTFDPKVRIGLAGVAPERRDAWIDAYERQALGEPAARDEGAADAGPARRRSQPRRVTVERIERCNDFLHERRLAGRTVEEAISDLRDLHETDAKRYREIVGDMRLYAAETFRHYYKQLDPDRKRAAAETSKRKRATGEAKPKYDNKFTG